MKDKSSSASEDVKDLDTLPIVKKIISLKWFAPLFKKILEHEKIGPPVKKILEREVLSYLICGVLTTLVGFFSFWVCRRMNMNALVSNVVSSAVAILFAFIVNKHFVFLSKDWSLRKTAKEFWRFIAGRLIVMAGESGLLYLAVDIMGFNDNICKIFTMILVVIVNYFISKFIF
ncbi:MAG: GtrA family protein [Clostridiales bacterium]|jgi:putative flippase GtrA|nr:GtrA family protein [Clostridiales bacterium]